MLLVGRVMLERSRDEIAPVRFCTRVIELWKSLSVSLPFVQLELITDSLNPTQRLCRCLEGMDTSSESFVFARFASADNLFLPVVRRIALTKMQQDWRLTLRCVDYPTGRLVRDAQLYRVGAGTQEIRRMLIGREFSQSYSLLVSHATTS